ncbi:hypothetical protein EDB81DRAFT_768297 [Dactylonectria macrodidyma]|uniref:Uncharacterized protein n=1 Tax=Dactylonectria macrodidyma TaxID=307937 RepID=A0A9P9D4T5_9HYPO|nr:hypothetical protein EDB81DRAFT_768297 [Dactylonectria macrodidyma]
MSTSTNSGPPSRPADLVVYNDGPPELTYRLPHTREPYGGIVALARRGGPVLVQHNRTGELVLARRTFLRDYGTLARVSHPHLARICCVFDLAPQSILIQEPIILSLFELVPLSEVELASGLSQLVSAFRYLAAECPPFTVDGIRVCLQGVVKVVLDVRFEDGPAPITTPCYWSEVYRITASGLKPAELSYLGHEFFRDTAREGIPQVEHRFLSQNSLGPPGMRWAAVRAASLILTRLRPCNGLERRRRSI